MNKLIEDIIEETLSNKLQIQFAAYIYTNVIQIFPNDEISKDCFEELLILIEKLFKTNNKSYEVLHGNGHQYIKIYDYDLSYFKKLIVFA